LAIGGDAFHPRSKRKESKTMQKGAGRDGEEGTGRIRVLQAGRFWKKKGLPEREEGHSLPRFKAATRKKGPKAGQ